MRFTQKAQRVSRPMLFLGVLVVLLMLAACGSTTANTPVPTPNASTPTVAAPTDLVTSGTLTVGSDTTYPPQEFVDTASGQATGFDIDLITAIATRMGLKVNIVKADFGTIIDSLISKRYDVVISAVTINADRQKKVDFVPYFNAGESLLVPKGNPKNITTIGGMCGLKVGVQNGTVEQDDANAADKDCKKAGKAGITITALQNQTDVVQLLTTGRVDATYQDSPVTDYYLSQNASQFQVGGVVVNAAPEGIVVRKGDTSMFNAVQTSFSQLKAAGTYNALFAKWHLSDSQKISFIDRRSVSIV
ncbi:MAG TPA: ABC transporter substrate-binding protein [Ktedonobacteraceae bacterium]|nr:ABC transporter substrate-binding protein [Ktedonobacteraceae bacterium]